MLFFKNKQPLNKKNKKESVHNPHFSFLLSEIKSDGDGRVGEELILVADIYRRLSKTIRVSEQTVIGPQFIEEFFNQTGITKKIKKMTADINLRDRAELSAISRRIQSLILRAPISKEQKRVLDGVTKNSCVQNKKMPLYCRLEMIGIFGGDISRLENRELAVAKNKTEQIFKKIISFLYTAELMDDREQRGFSHIGFPVAVMMYEKPQESTPFFIASSSATGKNILSLKCEDPKNKTEYFLYKPNLIAGTSAVLNVLPDQVAIPADLLVIAREVALAETKIGKPVALSLYYNRAGNSIHGLDVSFISLSGGNIQGEHYSLSATRKPLVTGSPVGTHIAVGIARILRSSSDARAILSGDIVVAKNYREEMDTLVDTAGAFVFESGEIHSGFSRQVRLRGKPCVIGAKNATKLINPLQTITVSCAGGGDVAEIYSGALPYEVQSARLHKKNKIPIQINGAGIISVESIIENDLAVHPLALCNARSSSDMVQKYKNAIFATVALAASSASPESVVISLSNSRRFFFERLKKGTIFERKLGLRASASGAERYLHPAYRTALSAECSALVAVHQNLNLKNIIIRLPYCRSPFELERMLESLSENGISREKGFGFSLTTNFPGHGLLTEAFAAHVDELVLDMDELVFGIAGEHVTSVNQEIQNAVETVLLGIVRSARRTKTSVAVSGSVLARQPKMLFTAVKSGVAAVVTIPEQAEQVRAGILEAESTVGNTGYGTNSRWLGLVAGIAALGGLLISTGAGCGFSESKQISPELTPAQIRAEITAAIEENNKQWETLSQVTSVINGFAHFQIQYPNAWIAEYKSDAFVLRNELSSSTLAFYIQLTPNNPSADMVTNFSVNGFPARLFSASAQAVSSSEYFYEITMPDNRILEISASPSDDEVKQIVESVVFL